MSGDVKILDSEDFCNQVSSKELEIAGAFVIAEKAPFESEGFVYFIDSKIIVHPFDSKSRAPMVYKTLYKVCKKTLNMYPTFKEQGYWIMSDGVFTKEVAETKGALAVWEKWFKGATE